MVMPYGKMILDRVDRLIRDVKGKFTLYLSKAVYEEFRRKCGERAPSTVLEEMMKHFNETTDEPGSKKPRSK